MHLTQPNKQMKLLETTCLLSIPYHLHNASIRDQTQSFQTEHEMSWWRGEHFKVTTIPVIAGQFQRHAVEMQGDESVSTRRNPQLAGEGGRKVLKNIFKKKVISDKLNFIE